MATVAGAVLGFSTCVKIWGAAAVVIAAVWLWGSVGRRCALWLLAGAAGAATVVCLPFFVLAPTAMFQMVVRDQLGRPHVSTPLTTRLNQLAGLWSTHPNLLTPALLAVLLVFGVLCVLAGRTRNTASDFALILLGGLTVVLLLTPAWFKHYAALIAGPLAVTVGFGVGRLMNWVRITRPRAAPIVAGGVAALMAMYALPVVSTQFGHRFPGPTLRAAVAQSPGCITSDDPTTLVEMNVLGRNLDRGCPLIVDLGGRSYDKPTSKNTPRATNRAWQQYALSYRRSGTYVIIIRFSSGQGFAPATAATVKTWPVVRRAGGFSLRRPVTGAGP